MKKTLTVNLGGRVFHIDEDAYYLLDKYLTNLRIHFSKEEGGDEILDDFEIRISELFTEYIKLGYDVITLERVEDVIKKMGKPEEIFGDDYVEEERNGNEERETTQKSRSERFREKVSRRLFRNPDDRILGGVASGIAAYMGWDPAVVRLIWFLLMFFYGVAIPVYFVLWIVVPIAHTATEKLQMRGESITVESIGKTVTDGFERATNNINNYIASGEPKSIFQKMADLVVDIIGFFVKFMFVCLSIIFVPVMIILLFAFVIVFGSLMIGGTTVLFRMMPAVDWSYFSSLPAGTLLTFSFCSILVVGIPLVAGIYGIFSYFFKYKPVSSSTKWVLIIIWTISLLAAIITGIVFGTPWLDMLQETGVIRINM